MQKKIIGLQFTKDGKRYQVVGDDRHKSNIKSHPWYKRVEILINEINEYGTFIGEPIEFTEEKLRKCQINCSALLD